MISILVMYYGKTALDTIDLPQSIYQKICTAITCPIAGFEHKRNADGTFFSLEQQLEATRQQVIILVKNSYIKGANDIEITKIISYFVK